MLWLMFPAYNEKENLVNLLPNLCAFLKGKIDDYRIIIINDGSTDSTPMLVNRKSQGNDTIRELICSSI